jgi:DNA-binding LacI/PurR family transcriptional regulator
MPRKPPSDGRPDLPHPALPGRAVTIKDIAARLGISHATVSRALNDHPATSGAAKARVREAADALGYIRNANAGALSGAASRLVGFVAPDVQSEFYATIASTLATSCALAGLQLVLAVTDDDPELEHRHILALRQARAAGVFITPTAGLLDASAALLAAQPVVQLVRSHPGLDKPWVGIDDRIGIGLATRHLLELGHTRIGYIGGYEALTTGSARRGGYQQALADFGVDYDETLVVLGSPRASFGLEAAVHLTQKKEPVTALVLGSSQLTLGALRAFQQLQLIAPTDLSVVGYSDPEWVRIWGPGLTTIGLPVEDIAASAAQLLLRTMTGPASIAPTSRGGVFFQPHLIERGSTAAIQAGA